MTTGNCCNPNPCCEPVHCGGNRWGASFAFVLVLFILLAIVGAAWF
jgi:uncharacterized protein (TIGR01732 family)